MSMKPNKNAYHLSFLPFTIAKDTIFINYKSKYSV